VGQQLSPNDGAKIASAASRRSPDRHRRRSESWSGGAASGSRTLDLRITRPPTWGSPDPATVRLSGRRTVADLRDAWRTKANWDQNWDQTKIQLPKTCKHLDDGLAATVSGGHLAQQATGAGASSTTRASCRAC